MVSKTEEWSRVLTPTDERDIITGEDVFKLVKDIIQIRSSVGLADLYKRVLLSDSGLNHELDYEEFVDGVEIARLTSWKNSTDGLETREVWEFVESHGGDRFKVMRGASYISPILGVREGYDRRATDEVALSMGARLKIARTVWRAYLNSQAPMVGSIAAFLATT